MKQLRWLDHKKIGHISWIGGSIIFYSVANFLLEQEPKSPYIGGDFNNMVIQIMTHILELGNVMWMEGDWFAWWRSIKEAQILDYDDLSARTRQVVTTVSNSQQLPHCSSRPTMGLFCNFTLCFTFGYSLSINKSY